MFYNSLSFFKRCFEIILWSAESNLSSNPCFGANYIAALISHLYFFYTVSVQPVVFATLFKKPLLSFINNVQMIYMKTEKKGQFETIFFFFWRCRIRVGRSRVAAKIAKIYPIPVIFFFFLFSIAEPASQVTSRQLRKLIKTRHQNGRRKTWISCENTQTFSSF